MQKVVQRTVRAERVANRKRVKRLDHAEKGESWGRFQQRNRLVRANGANIKNARLNRAEDWALGSIAPRRDVGDRAKNYGAIPIYDIHAPDLAEKDRPKWFPYSEGDRVVVMTGRYKGKIGDVTETLEKQGSVRVKGVNVTDVIIPEWMNREDKTTGDLNAVPLPLPLEDVRLVYPLPDPVTGIPRDVIIDRLIRMNYSFDKTKKEWTKGDRVILGTNTIIPWPETVPEETSDHDEDTLRITVEEQTFRPFLLSPPMPLSVIDELRNKYSKFRTRHEYEYVEAKEGEDAKVERRKELSKVMRTPLQELAEVRRKQREEKDKELSKEQLAKIGEVIAAEQAKAMGSVRGMAGK